MRSPRPAGATASGDGLRGGPSDHVDPLQPRHAPVRSPDGPAIPRRDPRGPRRAVRDPDRRCPCSATSSAPRPGSSSASPAPLIERRAMRPDVGHQDAGRPRTSRPHWGARGSSALPSSPSASPATREDGLMAARARARRLHRLPRHLPAIRSLGEEHAAHMKTRPEDPPRPSLGVYLLAIVVAVLASSAATRRDNKEFQPQNEFKLDTWINLPGPFDINKAVLYLVIAGAADGRARCSTSRAACRRARTGCRRPSRSLFTLMRDNITRGNMDDQMAAKWFPFIGTLFLFIWFSNLIGYIPLPTNTETVRRLRRRRSRRSRSTRRPRTSRSRSCSRWSSSSPTTSRASAPRASSATSRA